MTKKLNYIMNAKVLICLFVISIFVFLVFSCNANENKAANVKVLDSVNNLHSEVRMMPEKADADVSEETFGKEKVEEFIQWFKEQNKPFADLSEKAAISLNLNEGEEWDGIIPDYNKYQENILRPLKLSINGATLFADVYKNKLLKLLDNSKSNDFVLNLPSLLLESQYAFQMSHIFFDQVYDLDKIQTEHGKDSKIKRTIPSNSKLVLCNTGYNLAIVDPNPIILVYINEGGIWKIADIFSEAELFQ